ncbi:hypothetical protein PZC41_14825, partial [Staphylococcus aureus]|uniref:hypothetical protein n=1 Tax=Staphylococcus aureus TaxID=1280 RepID=UPI0023B0C8E9
CDLITYTTTTNAIAERIKGEGTVAVAVRCRLMRNAVRVVNPERTEQVNKLDAVYFDGTINLSAFQRIKNVRDHEGTLIEAGPLDVLEPLQRRARNRVRLLAVTVERVGHDSRV